MIFIHPLITHLCSEFSVSSSDFPLWGFREDPDSQPDSIHIIPLKRTGSHGERPSLPPSAHMYKRGGAKAILVKKFRLWCGFDGH